jgi:tetratricopeptide (TPR) repeat protein
VSGARSRRWTALVLLPLALLTVVACSQSPQAKKQKALERGEQFLRDGKASEAIIELRAALAIDRDFVPALHALGRAYAAKAWAADAARELTRAQTLAPESVAIAGDLGRSLLQVGAWAEADQAGARILSKEPQNPSGLYIRSAALLGLGKVQEAQQVLAGVPREALTPEIESVRAETLLRGGDLDGAEQGFRAAIAGDVKSAKPLVGLGRVHLARRKAEEARGFFEKAKALRPQDPDVRLGLAESMAQLGQVSEAVAELEGLDLRARSLLVQISLARFYLQQNRPAEVIAVLAPIVERFPKLPIARLFLGHAYLATRKADQAAAQFDELVRLSPDTPAFQFSLATAQIQQGRGRDALARLDPLAKPFEKLPLYHTNRAGALLLVGRLDDAVRAAEMAQRLAPQDPQSYLIIGQIRAQQGQAQAARDLFAKAAALNSNSAPAHLALGRLYASQKDMGAALKEFDRAVEVDPRSMPALRTKVAALMVEKRGKEAIEFLEATATRDPRNASVHGLLGAVYAKEGQPDKAAAAYRKAIEIDPRALDPRFGLALLAMRQGNDKEAITQLQAAVKEQPDHTGAVLLLTALHEKLAQYDLAVPMLESAAKAAPSQPAFGLALAEMYLRQGRYDEALARASDLVRQAPEAPAPHLIRGRALSAKGDSTAAIKELSDAVRLAPKWALAQFALSRALASAGRVPEAQAAYREAIALDPKLAAARPEPTRPGTKPDEGAQRERIGQLQEILKKDPGNLDARDDLARALYARGQVQEAQAELKQVLDRAPGRAAANLLMAVILMRQDKADDAAGYLRAALKSNPSLIDANLMLARYLQQRGRREEALTHLQAVLRVNPNLGGLYHAFGRLPEALALAQELERREPKSPAPAALAGWILLNQQSPEAAAEAFRRAVRVKADFTEAHRGLGQALQSAGQSERAIESYRQALTLNANDVSSLNNLAWLLSEFRKRPDEALPLATKAVELMSKAGAGEAGGPAGSMWDTLGWIQYRRGTFAEAERALSRAVELAPKNAAILFHLGSAQSKLGKKAAAVASLRRAAELSPDLARAERIPDLLKELGG